MIMWCAKPGSILGVPFFVQPAWSRNLYTRHVSPRSNAQLITPYQKASADMSQKLYPFMLMYKYFTCTCIVHTSVKRTYIAGWPFPKESTTSGRFAAALLSPPFLLENSKHSSTENSNGAANAEAILLFLQSHPRAWYYLSRNPI